MKKIEDSFGDNLLKTNWSEIKHLIKKANLNFYKIVEKIQPKSNLPIYIVSFRYGQTTGDPNGTYFPLANGESRLLSDKSIPLEISKDLGYGVHSSPLGMVLEKNIEWHLNRTNSNVSYPLIIDRPGDFINSHLAISSQEKRKHNTLSNSTLVATAGSKNSFMLPSISSEVHHKRLKSELRIKSETPTSFYDHNDIFKDILSSKSVDDSWRMKLIYFSEDWVNNIKSSKEWIELREFFIKESLSVSSKTTDNLYYDFMMSEINSLTTKKVNIYTKELINQLINVASGKYLGFSPVTDEESIPYKPIQEAYTKYYRIKHVPTIMTPSQINTDEPIYYSLKYPTAKNFLVQTRSSTTTITELDTLRITLNKYSDAFKTLPQFKGTLFEEIFAKFKFTYIHSKADASHDDIICTTDINRFDSRFATSSYKHISCAINSTFFNGCIAIKSKI